MAADDVHAEAHAAYAELSKKDRRRVIGKATLRMLLSIAILVVVFIVVPPADLATGSPGTGLLVGLVLLGGMVAWELRRVLQDPYPEVRAATSLMVLVVALVVVFALVYSAMSVANPAAFSEVIDKSDAIYFTVTTLSTTGFGDIAAKSAAARWVVTTQMLFDLVVVVGLARVFVLAAKTSRARRSKATPDSDAGAASD
jgi:hypothetical protein